MAGAYVRPLVEALAAINLELEQQAARRDKAMGVMRGFLPQVAAMGVPTEVIEKFEGMLK